MTDSRAKSFLSKYSNACVELDALPPTELRRRIRKAIEQLIDKTLWDRAVMVENAELASIQEAVAAGRGVPPHERRSHEQVLTHK